MDSVTNKPLVLVFTTAYTPFVGGAELAIQEISRRLKDDFEFVIITARLRRALRKQEIVSEGKIIRIGWGTRFDKLLLPILALCAGLRLSKKRTVLLWGVMVSYASIAAFFIKLFKKNVPFVLTIQEGNREWEHGLSAFWWRVVPRAANHVTAISNFLKDEVRKKGYQGTVSVVPNGVDESLLKLNFSENHLFSSRLNSHQNEEAYTDSDSKRFVQKTLGRRNENSRRARPPKPFGEGGGAVSESFASSDSGVKEFSGHLPSAIIFSASRLVYKNGIDLLLEAVAKLTDQFDCKVLLAGDGPEREKLTALAERLHIADRVEFLGNVPYENLRKHYLSADIFVRPSRSEGLGSAFLEAMAAGLITIGTYVGGIPDFLVDGQTGFLAQPDDIASLVGSLRRALLLDEARRIEIVTSARHLVLENFLWDSVALRMKEVFNSLL